MGSRASVNPQRKTPVARSAGAEGESGETINLRSTMVRAPFVARNGGGVNYLRASHRLQAASLARTSVP
jgi:hypothetical protein